MRTEKVFQLGLILVCTVVLENSDVAGGLLVNVNVERVEP